MPMITSCPANADGHVDAASPSTVKGAGWDHFIVGQSGTVSGNFLYRGLVRFDISGVPSNVTITSAKLKLYRSANAGNTTSRTVSMHRITENWGEATATWNNQPSHNAVAEDSINVGAYQWYEWDVTSLFQAWYEGTHINYGVKVIGTENVDYTAKSFHSREYADTDYRPYLEVTHAYPAPNPPTSLSPSSGARVDANENNNFTWMHNGYGDTQSAYQLQIFRVSDGATIVDTGKVVSATSQHAVAAETLANGVSYQWRVKTWNSSDAEGPYSSLASFYTSSPPVVSITDPPDEGTYNKGVLTVTWGYSDADGDPQNRYRAILMNALGATLEDSGEVVSAATSHQFEEILETDTEYQVSVQVWDDADQSGSDVSIFTTDFLAPVTPTIEVTDQGPYVNIDITNPVPQGEEPEVLYNHLYRRKTGETAWQRISRELPESGSYDDYAVASGVTYEYRVVAVGDNLTTALSTAESAGIVLRKSALHLVSDPASCILAAVLTGDVGIDYDRNQVHYEGRILPVSQFGIRRDVAVPVQIFAKTQAEQDALLAMLDKREVLCYRDIRGRKEFVTAGGLSVRNAKPSGYEITVIFDAVSFSEVV